MLTLACLTNIPKPESAQRTLADALYADMIQRSMGVTLPKDEQGNVVLRSNRLLHVSAQSAERINPGVQMNSTGGTPNSYRVGHEPDITVAHIHMAALLASAYDGPKIPDGHARFEWDTTKEYPYIAPPEIDFLLTRQRRIEITDPGKYQGGELQSAQLITELEDLVEYARAKELELFCKQPKS